MDGYKTIDGERFYTSRLYSKANCISAEMIVFVISDVYFKYLLELEVIPTVKSVWSLSLSDGFVRYCDISAPVSSADTSSCFWLTLASAVRVHASPVHPQTRINWLTALIRHFIFFNAIFEPARELLEFKWL